MLHLATHLESKVDKNVKNGNGHSKVLLTIVAAVLTAALALVSFFAREDRAEIKALSTEAHEGMRQNDKEIALLKASLTRVENDLKDLKQGQAELLTRLRR